MAKQPKALADARQVVPVLLTRPLDEGRSFANRLSERFGDRVRPLVAPLMAVQYLTPDLPAGPFAGVIFTSAAGVAGAVRLGADLPLRAFCVGARTAELAREVGFSAQSADGDADALVVLVQAAHPEGRLLHLRGRESHGNIAERLVSAGIETESVIIYQQAPQPLSPPGVALLRADGPVLVPLFSPRSAALFQEVLPEDARADLYLVMMSRTVTEAAARLPYKALVQARHPDAEAMLDAVAQMLEGPLLP